MNLNTSIKKFKLYISGLVLLALVSAALHFFNIKIYESAYQLLGVYASLIAGLFLIKKILKLG